MATPILTDLRHHWPKTKITALCQGAGASLLQENPYVDEILQFDRPKHLFSNEFASILQKKKGDLGILLTNSFSSAWWFWQSKIPYRLGYATHGRRWLLNLPISLPSEIENQHLVITYKMLLEPLGIPLSKTAPRLYLTPQEQKEAEECLIKHGISPSDYLIGINPGAAYGSAKCWAPERFRELCQLILKEQKVKIVFFGDKQGRSLVEQICRGLPASVINLAGQTSLRQVMGLIEKCSLVLTNDSGLMHLAAALGVLIIALFGSTNPHKTGPYQSETQPSSFTRLQFIYKHVPCSPCYRRECPLIGFPCMNEITVQEVYQAIKHLTPN